MLGFSIFCDAHFHLVQCASHEDLSVDFQKDIEYLGCSCSHEIDEYYLQKNLVLQFNQQSKEFLQDKLSFMKGKVGKKIICSFGIHPQLPLLENADFLEKLLKENAICAIGEAGIDLFNSDFKGNIKNQEKAWFIQLELAAAYKKTLIVHCRKALNFMFRDINYIKKIPSVIFHSFCGDLREALSLSSKAENTFFSFGKQIMNFNKKAISCAEGLPLEKLLFETDAPFQTLRSEKFTRLKEIERVYSAAYILRKNAGTFTGTCEDFELCILKNFCKAFMF